MIAAALLLLIAAPAGAAAPFEAQAAAVERAARSARPPAAVEPAPRDLPAILETLPTLSRDERGFDDSPVNLLMFGHEAAVRAAAQAAGWEDADRAPKAAAEPESFPPVSAEYLYGRRQDLALFQDVRYPRSRHHFRLWRAPFAGPRGETVWVGTANYDADIAFGWKVYERCGMRGFYHRIDPDIDAERAYIGATLAAAGATAGSGLLSRPGGVHSGVDSKCSPYHSDGRVLLLTLRPSSLP